MGSLAKRGATAMNPVLWNHALSNKKMRRMRDQHAGHEMCSAGPNIRGFEKAQKVCSVNVAHCSTSLIPFTPLAPLGAGL
jgi:hypothetical protein